MATTTRATQTTTRAGSSGIGWGGILFIVFLVLKLTGNIAWSWWWVTAPLWIPFAVTVAVLLVFLVIAVIATLLTK